MKSLKKSLCVLTASALLVTAPFVSASSPQQPTQPALSPLQMVIASLNLTESNKQKCPILFKTIKQAEQKLIWTARLS